MHSHTHIKGGEGGKQIDRVMERQGLKGAGVASVFVVPLFFGLILALYSKSINQVVNFTF